MACVRPGTEFNAAAQSNLTLELIDRDGSTVLTLSNDGDLGENESIQTAPLQDGTYFVRVTGDANAAQMYELNLLATGSGAAADAADFDRVSPFEGFASESTDNSGSFFDATDIDDFTVELAAGERLTGYLGVSNADVTATLEIVELNVSSTAAAPGENAPLPATTVPADGVYTFRVSADGLSGYDLVLLKNSVAEAAAGDSTSAAPVDLSPSSVNADDVIRLSAVGIASDNDVDLICPGLHRTLGTKTQYSP